MHTRKCDMLSARNTSLYAYGTYHTRMVIPYAYGIQNCTIRVWYIPYAYGIKYAYGTEHDIYYTKCSNASPYLLKSTDRQVHAYVAKNVNLYLQSIM